MKVRTLRAERLLESRNILGECPLWDDGGDVLWWVDVPNPSRLLQFDPRTGAVRTWHMPDIIASIATRAGQAGLIVASARGIGAFDEASGVLKDLLRPEPDKPFNRCNDGAVDPLGNFWFGTMQNNISPNGEAIALDGAQGGLFRLSGNLTVSKMESDIAIPNTVCWSPRGETFYFTDSLTGVISAYDFDMESAAIRRKRAFATFDRGLPDGSTVDAEGGLWNARWGGGCVVRFTRDGRVDTVVQVPCENVTSCTFMGPALETLVITTARFGLTAQALAAQPDAGGLFQVTPGVCGLPTRRFRA